MVTARSRKIVNDFMMSNLIPDSLDPIYVKIEVKEPNLYTYDITVGTNF